MPIVSGSAGEAEETWFVLADRLKVRAGSGRNIFLSLPIVFRLAGGAEETYLVLAVRLMVNAEN